MSVNNEYKYNKNFREYVERYCRKHKCTAEEALTHELVREAELYYKEKRVNNE